MRSTRIYFLSLLLTSAISCSVPDAGHEKISISSEQAAELAQPALHCIQKPYPYKPGHVLAGKEDLKEPIMQHPAFYGCFDWHSSVHGHWTLVKLLKEFPDHPAGEEIREKLGQNLTSDNISTETEFFYSEGNKTFERTYGWAWLLKLALELETWEDEQGRQMAESLRPLADSLVQKYLDFLDVLPYPIRVGEHTNTAFGLTFAWDYAEFRGLKKLKGLIESKAREFYLDDAGCPVDWEPGGFDFISPCLMEADLMTRVLGDFQYRQWLENFLPGILDPEQFDLLPAEVTDRTDPKIVHLDGLNLSRAWCLFHISAKLGGEYPHLEQSAIMHLEASLPYIASGNYEGEHWLASFAVFALYSQGQ